MLGISIKEEKLSTSCSSLSAEPVFDICTTTKYYKWATDKLRELLAK